MRALLPKRRFMAFFAIPFVFYLLGCSGTLCLAEYAAALKPSGIQEISSPVRWGNVLQIAPSRWMMIGSGLVCYSNDQGVTWSKSEPLHRPIRYAIRLNSGKIGGIGKTHFWVSADQGKTWRKAGKIYTSDIPASPYANTLIQAKRGRLILPVRFGGGAAHDGIYRRNLAKGTLNGRTVTVEGHAHFPEPDIAFVYYSDDEGATWRKSDGGIVIWHNDGYGGMWPCDEPNVVELRDGSIDMYCRTTLGRFYKAHSSDLPPVAGKEDRKAFLAGQRFDLPVPTNLAASYSPCAIKRISKTGDLLIVWNQVSPEEIRAGYRRGRLSSAISQDDGKTWKYFRTIDTVVLPPAGRIRPSESPQMVRSLDYVGILPKCYGTVDYPSVSIVEDVVFVSWDRRYIDPRVSCRHQGRRLRRVPLSFFYQDEKPSPKGPKLFLELATDGRGPAMVELATTYDKGTFFCSSKELGKYLKWQGGSAGKDIFGPIDQVISCMGWEADIVSRHVSDSERPPYVLIKPRHPHVQDQN